MALPFSLSDIDFVHPHERGVFKVGSSFYIVAKDASTTTALKVLKADSDDPSSGWTEQDSANRPSTTNNYGQMSAIVDGTTIHIIARETSANLARYSTFNTSTNAWAITNEDSGASNVISLGNIGVRSDGDVLFVHYGPGQNVMGTDYSRQNISRREGGTWTADIEVSNVGKAEVNHTFGSGIMADQTNNRFHVFYYDSTNADFYFSTYLNGNTWGHQHNQIDASVGTPTALFQSVIAFTNTQRKIRATYRDSGGISIAGFDDADSPTDSVVATAFNDNASPTAVTLAVDGTTQHALYTVSSSANIYHSNTGAGDDTWAADDTELTVGTSPALIYTSSVFSRSGNKLAYLLTDNGAEEYNERSIGAANTDFLPDALAYTHTLPAATFAKGHKVTADALAYTHTLPVQTFVRGVPFTADALSYTHTLLDPAFVAGRQFAADTLAHTHTLPVQTFAAGRQFDADALAYTHTLPTQTFVRGVPFTADALSYTHSILTADFALDTGTDFLPDTLTYTHTIPAATFTIQTVDFSADALSYTHTLPAATFAAGRQLAADALSYTHTLPAATLVHGYQVAADALSYTHSLLDPAFAAGRQFSSDALSYTHTLPAASFITGVQFAADTLTYTHTLPAATFVHGYQVTTDALVYTHTLPDALFFKGTAIFNADTIAYTYSLGVTPPYDSTFLFMDALDYSLSVRHTEVALWLDQAAASDVWTEQAGQADGWSKRAAQSDIWIKQ